jgi:SpoVK/Ycf46/Vps4 family AAA+-type ATPase
VGKLMDDLMKTVDKIRKNREKKLIDTSEQKQIVESEIRKVRTKINNHLDKLQTNLMKELTEEETRITWKTRELLSS